MSAGIVPRETAPASRIVSARTVIARGFPSEKRISPFMRGGLGWWGGPFRGPGVYSARSASGADEDRSRSERSTLGFRRPLAERAEYTRVRWVGSAAGRDAHGGPVLDRSARPDDDPVGRGQPGEDLGLGPGVGPVLDRNDLGDVVADHPDRPLPALGLPDQGGGRDADGGRRAGPQ